MLKANDAGHRSIAIFLGQLLSLGVAYFVCAKIGLLFSAFHLNVSPVWPGAGIALGALVLGSKRLWPAIVLGSLAADLTSGVSLFPAAGNATGNTVEALVGAWMLSRLFMFSPDLRRRRDAFALAAVSGLASVVGAAIGVAALVMHTIPASEAWYNFQLWWFGDAMGCFLFAPLIFVTFKSASWTRRNSVEAALGMAVTGIVTYVSLVHLAEHFPFTQILLTAIVVTLRLRQLGAVTSSVVVCVVAIGALISGASNPIGLAWTDAAVALQIATAVVAGTALLLSAILSERDSERIFLGAVLENLDTGVVACDARGTLSLFNRATRELHNLPAEPIPAREWAQHYDLYRSDGVTPMLIEEVPLYRALHGEHVHNAEMIVAPKDGEPRSLIVNGHSLKDERGVLLGAVAAMHDVTERRKAEMALSRQALHDALTSLPNRLLMRDRLEHALVGRERHALSVALLVLDLDEFKTVNDSLGHEVGDGVLITIAERLRSSLRPGDTVARLGGDEFAVILEDMTKDQALAVAAQIDAIVRQPISARGRSVTVGASIGIAVGEKGAGAEELLRNGDLAMHAAKSEGKGRVQIFDTSMHRAVLDRVTLDTELREAVSGDEFLLHYQPIVSLITGGLKGFEALVRWNHPKRGLISPGTFISVAETTGLIVPLGEWVLRTACLQARRWQDEHAGARDLTLHVNVSVRQLQSDSIVGVVGAALRDAGLRPDQLVLEVTESVVMHRGEALGVLEQLHEMGIRFAIDDFGTGYSSLGRLHSLPIDKVKIDKSFTDSVCDSSRAPMVAATIAMAHSLGLETVAEGVENSVQLPFLRLHGCDEVQGYFFGRPVGAATIDGLLRDRGTGRMWTDFEQSTRSGSSPVVAPAPLRPKS